MPTAAGECTGLTQSPASSTQWSASPPTDAGRSGGGGGPPVREAFDAVLEAPGASAAKSGSILLRVAGRRTSMIQAQGAVQQLGQPYAGPGELQRGIVGGHPRVRFGQLVLARGVRRRRLPVGVDPGLVRRFWFDRYAPDVLAAEARRYPTLHRIDAALGGSTTVRDVPIPLDCADGFNEAYYGRPERLLDASARLACSAWSFVAPEVQPATWTTSGAILRTVDGTRGTVRCAGWRSSTARCGRQAPATRPIRSDDLIAQLSGSE